MKQWTFVEFKEKQALKETIFDSNVGQKQIHDPHAETDFATRAYKPIMQNGFQKPVVTPPKPASNTSGWTIESQPDLQSAYRNVPRFRQNWDVISTIFKPNYLLGVADFLSGSEINASFEAFLKEMRYQKNNGR